MFEHTGMKVFFVIMKQKNKYRSKLTYYYLYYLLSNN